MFSDLSSWRKSVGEIVVGWIKCNSKIENWKFDKATWVISLNLHESEI